MKFALIVHMKCHHLAKIPSFYVESWNNLISFVIFASSVGNSSGNAEAIISNFFLNDYNRYFCLLKVALERN